MRIPGLFLLAWLALGQIAQADTPLPPATPIEIGQSFSLQSTVLGEAREVNVWLPASYAKGKKKYPVLYIIDGGQAQDFLHIGGLAQLGSVSPVFDELIVVGIATKVRYHELTASITDPRYQGKQWAGAGGSDDFRDFIKTEVRPFVEDNYRTQNRRAVIGESLAGLFITETFLKTPALFTDYIAISPSLWFDDKALAKQAPTLLQDHKKSNRRLYLTMASEGGTMQIGLEMVLDAVSANPPKGLDWSYVDRRDSETHSSIYHGAALDALRKLFGPAEKHQTTKYYWYLHEGGQPGKKP
jgi:predicted alpha/beta superfamily hydrolase